MIFNLLIVNLVFYTQEKYIHIFLQKYFLKNESEIKTFHTKIEIVLHQQILTKGNLSVL